MGCQCITGNAEKASHIVDPENEQENGQKNEQYGGSIFDIKQIPRESYIKQIEIIITVFKNFNNDISKIKKYYEENKPKDIINNICVFNSDDTCFEKRENLNTIKRLLKHMNSVFDYIDKKDDADATSAGVTPDEK
jgi:hypothetical protein